MEPAGNPPSAPEADARRVPELRPPAATPGTAPGGAGTRRGLLLLLFALGLAAAAVAWLPSLVGPPTARPVVTPAEPAQGDIAPSPTGPSAEARTAAERALQQYLKRRAELELLGADAWAADAMHAAAEGARAGDRAFGERRFDRAASRYAEAAARLEALAASRPERLAAALAEGQAALEADDGPAAARQFELALRLEPGHEEAAHGLARAEARPAVIERMNAGRLAELAGDLAAAEAAYREAAALDAEFVRAVEAAERVAAQREERAFGTAMSAALAALDGGRLAEAQGHLATAAGLRPSDRAVADARRRLDAARRAGELARLRAAAERHATDETWAEAGRHYRAALKIDPQAGFATAGAARAERQQRLNERIDHYLADPARLHAPEPLAEAERLLAAVTPPPAAEPRLAAKVARLAEHVRAAQTPRRVTLVSDGLTEVTLFHVGRLGGFTEKELRLRPGRYTVLGARDGYRDVRVSFTVPADGTPTRVDVACREAL